MGWSVYTIHTVEVKYSVPRGRGFLRAFRRIDRSLSARLRYLHRNEILKHYQFERAGDRILPSIRTALRIVSASDVLRHIITSPGVGNSRPYEYYLEWGHSDESIIWRLRIRKSGVRLDVDEQSPAKVDTVSDYRSSVESQSPRCYGSNILAQGLKLSQPGDVGVGDGWDGGYIEATG